MDMLIVMLFA